MCYFFMYFDSIFPIAAKITVFTKMSDLVMNIVSMLLNSAFGSGFVVTMFALNVWNCFMLKFLVPIQGADISKTNTANVANNFVPF